MPTMLMLYHWTITGPSQMRKAVEYINARPASFKAIQLVPSLCHHCAITVPSLCHHCTITTPSLYHHHYCRWRSSSGIRPSNADHHRAITVASLHHHCTITAPSLDHHCCDRSCTITAPSLHHHCVLICFALDHHCTITATS